MPFLRGCEVFIPVSVLMREMASKECVAEQVKTEDQLVWVRKMNNIRNRAEEIVLAELIYC